MKFIKQLFCLLVFCCNLQISYACPMPTVTIESCLGSTSWQTWGNDQYLVKEVCGETPLSFDVACSQGSLLALSDEVNIYEVDENGNELLVYSSSYQDFDFIPESGKTYRMEVSRGGSMTYEVTFETVNCIGGFEATQNGQSDCLRRGQPIDFSFPQGIDPDCYTASWDFGDCSDILYTGVQGMPIAQHVYNFPFTPGNLCKSYEVTMTLVSNCEGCPDFEIIETITVCYFCMLIDQQEDEVLNPNFDVSVYPNPTIGPVDVEVIYTGDANAEYLIISQSWNGNIIHTEQLPPNLMYPHIFSYDLSSNLPGLYNVTLISTIGETGNTSFVKE